MVTPDGEWHETGSMGWWGLSSETHEEAVSWEEGFYERFLATADPRMDDDGPLMWLMWQHLLEQIYERIRPASLNSTGLM